MRRSRTRGTVPVRPSISKMLGIASFLRLRCISSVETCKMCIAPPRCHKLEIVPYGGTTQSRHNCSQCSKDDVCDIPAQSSTASWRVQSVYRELLTTEECGDFNTACNMLGYVESAYRNMQCTASSVRLRGCHRSTRTLHS